MRRPDEPARWLRSNTQFPVRGSGAEEFSAKRFPPFGILSIALINNRRERRVKASKRVLLRTIKNISDDITDGRHGKQNPHERAKHRSGSKMRSIHRSGRLFSPRVWLISFQIWLSHISRRHTFWQEVECFDKWRAWFERQTHGHKWGLQPSGDRSVQVSVSGSSPPVSSLRADTDPYLRHNKTSPAEDKPDTVIIPVHLSVPRHFNQALSALKLEGHSWL